MSGGIKFERQALVPEASQVRKRWIVRLRRAETQASVIDHPTDQVDPSDAITEAVRKHVEYAYSFIPAVPTRVVLAHVSNYHPSVTEDGWLRILCVTELYDALPGEWHVRLQGYGGARDTGIQVQTS